MASGSFLLSKFTRTVLNLEKLHSHFLSHFITLHCHPTYPTEAKMLNCPEIHSLVSLNIGKVGQKAWRRIVIQFQPPSVSHFWKSVGRGIAILPTHCPLAGLSFSSSVSRIQACRYRLLTKQLAAGLLLQILFSGYWSEEHHSSLPCRH